MVEEDKKPVPSRDLKDLHRLKCVVISMNNQLE